jgi:hypothetical protein
MSMASTALTAACLLFVSTPAIGLAAGEAEATAIIQKRCLTCHNTRQAMASLNLENRASAVKGGKSGPALNPASPTESLIWQKIDSGQMPMGNPLPATERAAIRSWLESGAPWTTTLAAATRPRADKTWWSLQPLNSPRPGASIDLYVREALSRKGMAMSGAADRRTLIRRVTFDLTGLPPAPEEIAAFVADNKPRAYENVVDRLLASSAYGERWGRHWLDVARFGESHGYEQNHLRSNAWPYRDWVIRSFNEDKPFDRMVLEQLAGDVAGRGNPEIEVATGFLVAGPHDTVGNQSEAARRQQRADDLDDMINATAAGFLGLTVACARCHDHKFDPIRQSDYYRLQAVFAGVQHAEREIATAEEHASHEAKLRPLQSSLDAVNQRLKAIESGVASRVEAIRGDVLARYRPAVNPQLTEESFAATPAQYVRLLAKSGAPGGLDEIEIFSDDGRNVALAAAGAEVRASSTRKAEGNPDAYSDRLLNDGRFDRRWFAGTADQVEIVVEFPRVENIVRAAWSSDRAGATSERFALQILSRYEVSLSRDGRNWTTVATSENRLPRRKEDQDRLALLAALDPGAREEYSTLRQQSQDLGEQIKTLGTLPTVYAGAFREPEEPSYLLRGGNVMARQEQVAPASLSTLDHVLEGFELPLNAPESERRVAFARWLTGKANPLTPRVLANRIWHYHFGRGLAGTPSDFGFNGEKPTHPELLDYLASRLLEHGWRLKPLHREIVLSAAYRQSSAFNEMYAAIDAESRYLWRFPPQRMTAEGIRDSMLAAAGKLDRKLGGPGFQLYRYTVDNVATYFPLEEFGPETYRRSIYLQSARSIRAELLAQYDCPDSSLPEPKRVVTTSPLQALSLLNNSFAIDMSRALAERMVRGGGVEIDARIKRGFLIVFGRAPSASELKSARMLADRHGLAALARALFNSNEFVYVM